MKIKENYAQGEKFMATLSAGDRANVRKEIIDLLCSRREPLANISKQDATDAVTETDNWIDNNVASFNSALNTNIKNNLTTKQKYELFFIVGKKRWAAE